MSKFAFIADVCQVAARHPHFHQHVERLILDVLDHESPVVPVQPTLEGPRDSQLPSFWGATGRRCGILGGVL